MLGLHCNFQFTSQDKKIARIQLPKQLMSTSPELGCY